MIRKFLVVLIKIFLIPFLASCSELPVQSNSESNFLSIIITVIAVVALSICLILLKREVAKRKAAEIELRALKNQMEKLISNADQVISPEKKDSAFMRFDLFEQIDNVISAISFQAAEQNLELLTYFDLDLERFYLGDSLLLNQVLSNLLSNAVQFTSQGSVTIKVKPIDKGKLHFEVQDTGIGISEDYQKDISRFFSGGNKGSGLEITGQLIEQMNGRIWVESELDSGSTFFFEVDMEATGEELCCAEFPGKKVLIVEQNKQTLNNLSQNMMHCGIITFCAGSGNEALNLSADNSFDLILLSWRLPDMNGIEANKIIRDLNQSKAQKHPPTVIMVGGFGQESIVTAARDEGVFSLIYKPLNPSLLQDVMLQAFQSSDNLPSEKMDFPVIKGRRMLLVEVNSESRYLITGLLEDSGITIDFAENGQQALERTGIEEYDIILMDTQMPVMDGYTAACKIRNIGVTTPIVALSANVLKDKRDKALECGMNEYLEKPIDLEKFYTVLLKYIKLEPSSDELNSYKLPAFKSIDIDFGLKHFAGNSRIYSKILLDFCNNTHLPDRGNLNDVEITRYIHTLKGLSGKIGALELRELCNSWEEDEKESLLETIQKKLHEVCSEIDLLLRDVTEEN